LNRLPSLGLTQSLLSQVFPDQLESRSLGRVMFESHTHCVVAADDGDHEARLHPRLHDDADRVVVGDWVILDRTGDPYWIVQRLERQRLLARRDPDRGIQVLCANIDVLLVATALDRDLNERRLERYLMVAADAELPAILVLTKCDLSPELVSSVADEYRGRFQEVLAVSALRGEGLDAVRACVPRGVTAALLGSSGVGKTTLINALAGTTLDTGAIRDSDQRGRHTTTTRRLVPLPGGGWLVDNPGLRQVGPIGSSSVSAVFADVEELTLGCRFRDCQHSTEPGCAILAAIESGALSAERYSAYQKLEREIAYESRRRDKDAARAERAKWKRIHREQRERDTFRRKNE
jgi:ribosome biogenesis GTPase